MILAQSTNKNNTFQKSVRQSILLIDSEVLRKPFNAKYNHAQDQRIRKKAEKIDLNNTLKKIQLYCFVDYSSLIKSSIFTKTQAEYSSQFLLNMFAALQGCFLFENFCEIAEKSGTILYIKNSTLESGTNQRKTEHDYVKNRYCGDNVMQILIPSAEKNISHLAEITNYFQHKNLDNQNYAIEIISNNETIETMASNNSICYRNGEEWLESITKQDYG